MNNMSKNIILAIIFVVSVILIFVGQKDVGYTGLTIEIVGLIGILGVLFAYNRRYK